ncbi:MAG: Yae1 family protein, partial [Aquificaceae bacterium]
TLTELRPKLRIRLSEEVRHMPIVVRPEDIRLPKRKLRKDILYRLGLEEGKQIGLEEGKQIGFQEGEIIGIEKGLLKSSQEMVIAIIEGKLGYVPEGVSDKIRSVKDREFLRALAKRLVVAEDVLKVLKEELGI